MRALLLITAFSIAGCTVFNHIDVCERSRPSINETNIRTEGSQLTDGAQPMAPVVGGGALLVFTSITDPNSERTGTGSIRGMLIDPQGHSLRTCDAAGETEYAADIGQRQEQPSVAMPSVRNENGLIVWERDRNRVVAQFVSQSGCPEPPMQQPFEVSLTTSCGRLTGPLTVASPTVMSLGDNLFRVIWIELDNGFRGVICTRDVHLNGTGPEFPGTPLSTSGDPATLVSPGNAPLAVRAVSLDHGSSAVVWLEASGTLTAQMALFDARLTRIGDQRMLGTPTDPLGMSLEAFGIAAVWDGSQLFTVWSEIRSAGETQLMMRVFDDMGRPLRTPLSSDGAPVRLGTSPSGIEGRVSGAALHGGGALFAYERRDSNSDGAIRGIDVASFDGAGGRRFMNAACGTSSFELAPPAAGISRLPAVVRLENDTTTLAWTVDMAPGADRSGSALRSTAFDLHTLLPVP